MAVISNFVYINEKGFHYPDYETILNLLKTEYKNIYGSDVYLENDSQDGQWLAIQALAMHELAEVAAGVYSSFSPSTSKSDSLSKNVKINGIRRAAPSFSTVDVKIVGEVGTLILNGIVKDVNENKWILPERVVIDKTGEIVVTARSEKAGAVTAAEGTVNVIFTPQRGWQSVTNEAKAIVGKGVESDTDLRIRQSLSVAIPSQALLEGLHGALLTLENVGKLKIYENDTAEPDANGLPPHSICVIVLGGDAQKIGQIIGLKKTIGVATFGDVSVSYVDRFGLKTQLSFFRPSVKNIFAQIKIKPLNNYLNTLNNVICQYVADYINNLAIGETIYLSKLFVPANLLNDENGKTFEILDLKIKDDTGDFAAQNIQLGFKEMAKCAVENIQIIVEN